MSSPPKYQEMDRDGGPKLLASHESLFVKQTKRGCIKELLGCEATNEFKIYPSQAEVMFERNTALHSVLARMTDCCSSLLGMLLLFQAKGTETLYSLEESTFLMRFCCKNQRAFTQTIWSGSKDNKGSVVMTMDKSWTCPVGPCTCCCIPAISYKNPDGSLLGSADVPMFMCLPKIAVKDESGQEQFAIQMPSCCGGMCVDCMAEGCCNCKVPFYIYPPGKGAKGEEIGKIVKLWRGMGTEMFSDAASFNLEFPKDADDNSKARLLGSTMFINMLFFEKGNE